MKTLGHHLDFVIEPTVPVAFQIFMPTVVHEHRLPRPNHVDVGGRIDDRVVTCAACAECVAIQDQQIDVVEFSPLTHILEDLQIRPAASCRDVGQVKVKRDNDTTIQNVDDVRVSTSTAAVRNADRRDAYTWRIFNWRSGGDCLEIDVLAFVGVFLIKGPFDEFGSIGEKLKRRFAVPRRASERFDQGVRIQMVRMVMSHEQAGTVLDPGKTAEYEAFRNTRPAVEENVFDCAPVDFYEKRN